MLFLESRDAAGLSSVSSSGLDKNLREKNITVGSHERDNGHEGTGQRCEGDWDGTGLEREDGGSGETGERENGTGLELGLARDGTRRRLERGRDETTTGGSNIIGKRAKALTVLNVERSSFQLS